MRNGVRIKSSFVCSSVGVYKFMKGGRLLILVGMSVDNNIIIYVCKYCDFGSGARD